MDDHELESFRDASELQPFLLTNVRPTEREIGVGAYGTVYEVEFPGATCAAKVIHGIHLRLGSPEEGRRVTATFVSECKRMSALRHPHIVQFLGVCFIPELSSLPALVMERLMTSLHDLLETHPSIPLSFKCSFLLDVARGLAYLHNCSPPIIHRDLSAKNVLLNSSMVCKLADLGVSRMLPRGAQAATMTKAPGTPVFMPPEALADGSRYNASIDIFSFGVLTMFVLTQTFPKDLLEPTYQGKGKQLLARSELDRRDKYMKIVRAMFRRFRRDHPLIQLVKWCLENFPDDRPTADQVIDLIQSAVDEIPDPDLLMTQTRLDLVEALSDHHDTRSIGERSIGEQTNVALTEEIEQKNDEIRKRDQQILVLLSEIHILHAQDQVCVC